MQRLAWIHVQYGNAKTKYYRRKIGHICSRLSASPSVFVVENDPSSDRPPGVIAGTNTLREFSGWSEGLVEADRNGHFDWYVFTNDTFAHHRFFWGTLFHGFVRQFRKMRSETSPVVIADIIPGRMLESEHIPYSYASTFFFMLNSAALDLLDRDMVASAPLHWVTDACEGRLTADSCPSRVADFLALHITSETSPYRWRQAAPLTDANASQLRFKALAVVLEHWLSYRMKESQIQMIPVIDRFHANTWRLLRGFEAMVTRCLK